MVFKLEKYQSKHESVKVQTKADEGLGDQKGNQMVNVRREYIGTGGVNWKRIGRISSVGTMLTNRLNVIEEVSESNAGAFGINLAETQTKEAVG